MKRSHLIILISLLSFAPGCQSKSSPSSTTAPLAAKSVMHDKSDREISHSIESYRSEKDSAFKSGEVPAIPPSERANFQGLKYFPIDPGYRFEAELKRYPDPEHVKMLTSAGEPDDYIRYGYFAFKFGDKLCKLDVFEDGSPNGDPQHLFIPFRDETSGKETYGAGRYLELKEDEGPKFLLDFNMAYNPFCAYNPQYSCPIPPPQNTLKVEMRAGEKSYH